MSGVAGLYNVPTTKAELDTWSFVHAAHHRDIIQSIYQLGNVVLVEFPLDPINPASPDDMEVWSYQHQAMHEAFDQLLGIAGFDLLDVDWSDKNQVAGWIFLNADEHVQAANLLGIG